MEKHFIRDASAILLQRIFHMIATAASQKYAALSSTHTWVFSFIGNSTLRSFTLRERLRMTESWTHIESRQFIGWWRDAVSDAMTSSGHTGERAIHSSDFSAFTKRSHRPTLLRFLTHLLPLRLSICTSATASVELCFSSRWSAMEFRRCIPPCARFIAREDPHSKCILCHFSTPSSSVSREQPPPRREPPSGGAQATRLPPTTVWGARGRSSSRQQPRKRVKSGLIWSGPTSLPLRLTRVVPDLRVGMRRVVSPLRGEARPRKRFCPPRTHSAPNFPPSCRKEQ